MANSIAFWHASALASSLSYTRGPLTDKIAMTSPLSFRIIAPTPKQPKSEKMAASKSAYSNQLEGVATESHSTVYSVLIADLVVGGILFAHLHSCLGSFIFPPCITTFVWFQITHDEVKNNSNSSLDSRFSKSAYSCNTSPWPLVHFCSLTKLPDQTSWATEHSHKTWIPFSRAVLHYSQYASSSIFLRARFTLVGKIFWQAVHPKTLILFGTFNLHSFTYTPVPLQPVEHSAQFSVLIICLAKWYPEFIDHPWCVAIVLSLKHFYDSEEFDISLQCHSYETSTKRAPYPSSWKSNLWGLILSIPIPALLGGEVPCWLDSLWSICFAWL